MLLPQNYANIIIDEVSSTVTYIGYANTNFQLTSAAVWAIYKITSASGSTPTGVTTIQGAGAPMEFDQIWDNRVSLTYRS